MFEDQANKNGLDSSGSELDTAPVKKVVASKPKKAKTAVVESSEGEDAAAEIMTVDSDSEVGSKVPARDEFDISDSDDGGGFARKVASAVKVKKPPAKKLAKKQDLFRHDGWGRRGKEDGC